MENILKKKFPFTSEYNYNINKKNIKYIAGPYCYYKFKKDDRIIFLFGEHHDFENCKYNKENTSLLPNLIIKLANKLNEKNERLDLFLEIPLNNEVKYDIENKNNTTLPFTQMYFEMNKKPDNLFLHYTDLRLLPEVQSKLNDIFIEHDNLYKFITTKNKDYYDSLSLKIIQEQYNKSIYNDVKHGWKSYFGNVIDNYFDALYENFKELEYVNYDFKNNIKNIITQIKKKFIPVLNDVKLYNNILNTIEYLLDELSLTSIEKYLKTIKNIIELINMIYNFIKQYEQIVNTTLIDNELINSIENKNLLIENILETIDVLIDSIEFIYLDSYAIGRMLREFKHDDLTILYNNSIISKNTFIPKNIIFYAGSNHTKRIKSFLSEFGWTLEDKIDCNITNENNYNWCIPIEIDKIFS